MRLLEVDALTVRFGGLTALHALAFSVEAGAMVALIGPNGAGKTTAFNVISGVYAPTDGEVRLLGKRISGLAPHRVARLGVARTFQNIRLFRGLTALDNVRAALGGAEHSSWRDVLRGAAWQRRERELESRARDLLARMSLSASAGVAAEALPYGEQRRLEIARALATGPELLLLDEPAAGMNPAEKQELRGLIRRLRDEFGLTIVLIEHDVRFVMDLCDQVAVLDHGEKIADGSPDAVRRDPRVIQAYLGDEAP